MHGLLINMDDMMANHAGAPLPPGRRAEGFPGQHLIVLPSLVRERMQREPALRDLFVTASGSFPHAPGHYVERRLGIADTVMIRVLRGSGWIEAGTRREATSGEIILIPEGVPHVYGADERDPWMIEWIHFQGSAASSFVGMLGAREGARVLRGEFDADWSTGFAPVCETLEKGYTPLNLLRSAMHLRTILTSVYARLLEGEPGGAEARVRNSMEWMLANLASRPSLAELARHSGLSVPHYCSLFRKLAGYPPVEHMRRLNIQRACHLLDMSLLPVAVIAKNLGWEDPLYFSRCFRNVTGKSPTQWRRDNRFARKA